MRLPKYIVRQLGKPSGILGKFMLWSLNRSNQNMNAVALKYLEISPKDEFLEVGFGGGALLNDIMHNSNISVAGVEISDLAIHEMTRRNKQAVKRGMLNLAKIEHSSIPYPSRKFTKVCCVNVVYFLDDLPLMLLEINRVLKAGGRLVVCYQEIGPNERISTSDMIEFQLDKAGFIDSVSRSNHDPQNGDFLCTTASKP